MNDIDEVIPLLEARVKRGAALLDSRTPDWHEKIAADQLAMETCDQCVMGQLFGDYKTGCRRLVATLPRTFWFSAGEHGFTLLDHEQPIWSLDDWDRSATRVRFAALADLWRAEVRLRLDAVKC